MNEQSYQQRVIEEKEALDQKLDKLMYFIDSNSTFKALLKKEQELLIEQSDVMLHYSEILRERILSFPKGE